MIDRGYPVIILELRKEDGGGFFALAPDLPGCVGDGATRGEAVTDLESAIGEWIDEAQRLKRAVPKTSGSSAPERAAFSAPFPA